MFDKTGFGAHLPCLQQDAMAANAALVDLRKGIAAPLVTIDRASTGPAARSKSCGRLICRRWRR
ncbi:MAG: hypothetical protein ACK4YM_05010 [Novosphingobium sp.]